MKFSPKMKSILSFSSFSFLLSLSTFFNSIVAFDTGHHYDLTRNILMYRGFNQYADSIPVVQVENYMTGQLEKCN